MDDRFVFDHARCVDEAFKKIATGQYDIIISDYDMYQKNGLQFLEELRKQNPGIPFILFTGKGREEVAIKALNLGADGYVNKQGKPETVYGELFHLTNQILKRKQAELSQIESEEKFRLLAEKSVFGTYIIQDAKMAYVNPTFARIFGYLPQEIIGKLAPKNLIHPDDIQAVMGRLQERLEGKTETDNIVYRGTKQDGSLIYVEVYGTAIEYQGKPAVMGTLIDVTRRKRAEEAAERSAVRFYSLYENSFDAILLTKPNGSILSANPAACLMFGMSEEEIKNAGRTGIVVTDERLALAIREREQKGRAKAELTFRRKDGSTFEGETTSSIFVDADGIANTSMIIRDITERKKLELELKQKYDVLERVGESIGAGLAIIGKDYSICWANKLLREAMFETNKKCYQTFNKLDSICPDCGVKKVFEQDVSIDVHEYKTVNSKGETIWIELRVTPLKDKNGVTVSALELAVPIADRKNAENALRESEERFSKAFHSSPVPQIITRLNDWRYVDANESVLNLLEYTRGELIGHTSADLNLITPGKRDQGISIVSAQSGLHDFETNVRTKSGRIITLLSTSETITIRGQKHLISTFLDITQRKHDEEALKESEERSRTIVANSPIGIATSNANKHFLSANEAFCKIIGYTEDELRKLTFKDITHPDDLKESAAKMAELENGKISSFTLEKRYIRKDGTTIDGKIMVSAVRNQKSETNLFVAELEDITELKKAEEHRRVLERKVNDYSKHLKYMVDLRTAQLKDANERLLKSERLAAIGELAGMVGHDLRNPLAGIRNATYFLKKKGKEISEAQAKEMLEIIDDAITHSDKIINDLLDYSREMHLEVTESALPTLLNTALRMIQVPDRIKILNYVHEEVKITVDTDKMIRIFVNLIKNAIEAMPDQGTLEISSCHKKDWVEIVFADTGKGILEETLPKIFTPLFTTKAQGMGFGLAICKRIIEAHGGTIKVKTALNKGTTFTIFLPKNPKVLFFENQQVLENQNAN